MEEKTKATTSSFNSILDANKNAMSEIDTFKKSVITAKPRNLAFLGLSISSGVLFILFASQIITGMLALILTVGVGVGGWYGLKFLKTMDPLIQQKTKNSKLKWMVEEARKNAIYQLDNQVLANRRRLLKAREARDKMGALVRKLKGKIDPANAGKDTYKRKQEILDKVTVAYERMIVNLDTAGKSNEAFKLKVIEYKDMDSFANLANEAMSVLGESGSKELENMLSLESFNSIEDNFNTAIVSIENSARDYETDNGYA